MFNYNISFTGAPVAHGESVGSQVHNVLFMCVVLTLLSGFLLHSGRVQRLQLLWREIGAQMEADAVGAAPVSAQCVSELISN